MNASCLDPIISDHFAQYLCYLKDLIAMRTVFTEPEGIKQAIQYCRDTLAKNLPGWDVYFDANHNLIARPQAIDPAEPIIYLSAHIDTVDADASAWAEPHTPFDPFEDDQEIRGRGASDCKAGVAYQLFLACLQARRVLDLGNLIFTITFNEEGCGDKTATEIGRQLGTVLPVSESGAYFIVLENNVRAQAPPVLCVYHRERGNYVIKTRGSLEHLQTWLKNSPPWNPVCIYPNTGADTRGWDTAHQESRHACSVPREDNLLYRTILDASQNTVLKAGQARNFGVVPASIAMAKAPCPVPHTLILSNRSFDTLEQVKHQLRGLTFLEMKPFAFSQGLDQRHALSQSTLMQILKDCRTPTLDIELTDNIGCSDASIIYNTVSPQLRERLLFLVMGPGTRSQPYAHPPRFTHGRNETFDKQSGRKAMIYISNVLSRLGVLQLGC
ncbi:MAG: M20/M25/M40 family metallo-hydrolase [Planctomycetes bacterium]|nr:M20/M25/M40 family metallo-hydrolase [Planctomycetota bacterium]